MELRKPYWPCYNGLPKNSYDTDSLMYREVGLVIRALDHSILTKLVRDPAYSLTRKYISKIRRGGTKLYHLTAPLVTHGAMHSGSRDGHNSPVSGSLKPRLPCTTRYEASVL